MKHLFFLIILFSLSCNKDSTFEVQTEELTINLDEGKISLIQPDKSWTEDFMELVNSHRTGMGLHALRMEESLNDIASTHAMDMATAVVPFGHMGFSTRCLKAKMGLGGGNWCGENVATGQRTPKEAFTTWINSQGHKANIEQSRATYTGFGYAKNLSGKFYWTQLFIEY